MRKLSIVLVISVLALIGCGGDDDSGGDNPAARPSVDSDQVATLKHQVVSGEFAPTGCASRDITRFLSSPDEIASQDKTNKQFAKIGAPGHEVVTDDTGQIGVDTYKASAECMQAVKQTLNEATSP